MPANAINILLVEDNPGDVRLARETLSDYNMQNHLQVAGDGEEALMYLRQQGKYAETALPDIVLLDLSLPKIDGLEVLAEMRKDAVLRDVPVVLLTASRMDEQMLKGLRIQTDCCIPKPLTLERYLEAIKCFPQFGLSIVRLAYN
jgi:CheY-like chemotaxis protein